MEGRRFLDLPATTPTAPVRVYVDVAAAADDTGRAAAAVDALQRTGGPARGTVLVIVPTGSGWVDPAAVRAYEDRLGGDVATVVVQYADRPSWVEYLLGGHAAERSAAATLTAVRAALPPDGPRLVLLGESLGAAAALPVARLADECVLAGRPGSADDPQDACTELANPDDPVVAWSPGLLLTDPVRFWQVSAALLIAQDVPPGHGHRYRF
ncbi:alpha/beta-hydrolase family protein [Pseudonocardia oroxyli]|uniref:Alpha/beta-hydrolase family protein n=1 Tax=Pseudonocardia oroxyli TaxID=366584 RepID=A0A1G7ZY32_PSEOR|nr:alpha/beta-hydrolase family protein [Pseudonocardia oroxyli]SDH13604.1 Alpha/beta-hydrolase family protein [Pseudonocardia oroxyli]